MHMRSISTYCLLASIHTSQLLFHTAILMYSLGLLHSDAITASTLVSSHCKSVWLDRVDYPFSCFFLLCLSFSVSKLPTSRKLIIGISWSLTSADLTSYAALVLTADTHKQLASDRYLGKSKSVTASYKYAPRNRLIFVVDVGMSHHPRRDRSFSFSPLPPFLTCFYI